MAKHEQKEDKTFKAMSKDEIRRIQKENEEKKRQREEKYVVWVRDFEARRDVRKRSDGRYDVDGDVKDVPLRNGKLLVSFNKVGGNFECPFGLIASQGIPKMVDGDFTLHTHEERFTETEADIKKICQINGKADLRLPHNHI